MKIKKFNFQKSGEENKMIKKHWTPLMIWLTPSFLTLIKIFFTKHVVLSRTGLIVVSLMFDRYLSHTRPCHCLIHHHRKESIINEYWPVIIGNLSLYRYLSINLYLTSYLFQVEIMRSVRWSPYWPIKRRHALTVGRTEMNLTPLSWQRYKYKGTFQWKKYWYSVINGGLSFFQMMFPWLLWCSSADLCWLHTWRHGDPIN